MPDPISNAGTTAPASGNAQNSAPATGQPAQSGQQPAAQVSAQAQPPAISPEQLMAEVLPKRTPEDELSLLRSRYEASSQEGKRVNEQLKALATTLEEQGLQPVFGKDGKFQGLKATDKYSKDASVTLDDELMTAKEKELLTENPEKAIKSVAERVLDRAKKAFVRAIPTVDQAIEPLTQERLDSVHGYLKGVKTSLGNELYPDYDNQKGIINQMVNSPNLPKAVKAALSDPESSSFMVQMLLAHTLHTNARLTDAVKARAESDKQKAEANKTGSEVQPTGIGRAEISGAEGNQAFLQSVFGKK